MIASLVAFVQIFAAADPAGPLRDLQRSRPVRLDLRQADPRVVFEPAPPEQCRFVSVAFRYEYDRQTASYFPVYSHFTPFFSDATVENHGLDLYSQAR